MRLPKNFSAESLTWLNENDVDETIKDPEGPKEVNDQPDTSSNINKIGHRRRMSVIGCGLFSVNKNIVEKGTDFLEKVPRTNNNVIQQPKSAASVKPVANVCAGLDLLGQYESSDSETEFGDGENVAPDDEISGAANQPSLNDAIDEISSSISNVAISQAESVISRGKTLPLLLPLVNNAELIDSIDRRMPRVNADSASGTVELPQLFNDFCPFRRLPNLPFVINGRPRNRSQSVDCNNSRRPPLETLFETEEEHVPNAIQPNIPIENHHTIRASLLNDNNGLVDSPVSPIVDLNFADTVSSGREFAIESEFNQTQKTLDVVSKWIARMDD